MQGTSSCIGLNLDSFTSSPVITQSSQFIHSAVDLYRLIYGAKLSQQITLSVTISMDCLVSPCLMFMESEPVRVCLPHN